MCSQTTPPAEAYAPDADRAGPDAFAHPPEWLVHILAMLILFLLQHTQAMRLRRFRRTHAWWRDRPDLPAGSAQGHAASVRGPFGRSIAWMCRRHGIGPGHKDWPELSRAIVAFGGSLQGFCAGAPPSGLYWWENPGVVAGMVPFPSAPRRIAATAAGWHRRSAAGAYRHTCRDRAYPVARILAPGSRTGRHRSAGHDRAARLPGTANAFMSERTGPEHGWPRRPDSCRASARSPPIRATFCARATCPWRAGAAGRGGGVGGVCIVDQI